jgi:hypothetical protein
LSRNVVVHFRGRLGNQLFQYYTALAVARRAGAQVSFDPHWENALDILRLVPVPEAPPSILNRVRGTLGWQGKLYRLAQQVLPSRFRTYWREPYQGFDARLLRARSGAFLDGYWQSYRYFADLPSTEFDRLRTALQVLAEPDAWLDRGRSAVVVHVRRTDYKGVFPMLTLDYYRQAMDQFPEQEFLVVSDDPVECQQLFAGVSRTTVLTDPGRTLWQDLYLLTQAAGVIAANSTFSWWGAYLNPQAGKVVVPQGWFTREPGFGPDLDVLFPPSWIRI